MEHISEALIKEAEKVDIVTFCQENGYPLEKKGAHYYFGVEHDSLVVNEKTNRFYWNSQNISGNAITFVRTFYDLSFADAVTFLTKQEYQKKNPEQKKNANVPFTYAIQHDLSTKDIEHYLTKERGIDSRIVNTLIKKGFLRQDVRKNCVFIWGDMGKKVGADLQGTWPLLVDEKPRFFKQIYKNSKNNYGFNITIGEPKSLYFFESPIDLMSYWSLNMQLKNCRLISMNGVKPQTVTQFIHHTKVSTGVLPTEGIFLGVDNDKAGQRFFDHLKRFSLNIENISIPIQPLIPGDNHIPSSFTKIYRDAANQYQIDWKWIAAIHKAETNFGHTNEITNYVGYGKFFGKVLAPKEKPEEMNLQKAIFTCAQTLSTYGNERGQVDIKQALKTDLFRPDVLQQMYEKASYYNDMYQKGRYVETEKNIKDWNDVIRETFRQLVKKEKNRLVFER